MSNEKHIAEIINDLQEEAEGSFKMKARNLIQRMTSSRASIQGHEKEFARAKKELEELELEQPDLSFLKE